MASLCLTGRFVDDMEMLTKKEKERYNRIVSQHVRPVPPLTELLFHHTGMDLDDRFQFHQHQYDNTIM